MRHGKPTSATNPTVNALGYTQWVRRYNASDVAQESRPETFNEQLRSCYAVSSDLTRAIHTANIYLGRSPISTDKLYREMHIPRYKLPLRLKAWTWLYLSRVLWMLGVKGSFESFKQAKERADIAADKLIELAKTQGEVLLFGHAYLNIYIRKSLIKKGWQVKSKSNSYWGVSELVLNR